MKNILIPALFLSAGFALYEQSKPKPNLYIMCAAIVIFMVCMMKLGNKIPSKSDKHNEDDTQ
ncbi:MAG: hypothetical protein CFE23_11450 [Flavobacterium sp. BFFFF1]|uniref:hypothetical protein n=1 Tax=unclassified Flavobacterium TaxID=196869 RepID=UPI000BC502C7|nr:MULTISPECIES: hypothetical protein [unclassified Flavobacterium]OYU79995.1 MAG: hypothetical protein CFE23_11450 [Flavobacterium sp. BFFFF1]